MIDTNNTVWVGGWGSSITRIQSDNRRVNYLTYDRNNPASVSDSYVQKIFQDEEGDTWVGTYMKGLNLYQADSNDFKRFPYNVSDGTGTSSPRIWSFAQLNPEKIWMATDFGLNSLDKTSESFRFFLPHPDEPGNHQNKMRHLLAMPDGRIAIGSHNGILLFDPKAETFEPLDTQQGEPLGPVYSLIKTKYDGYWFTTGKGVYKFNESSDHVSKVKLGFDDSCAQTLFEDRQGILWLSCEGRGLYRITHQPFFQTFSHPDVKNAYSVLAEENDNVLVGTENSGIFRWDTRTNKITQLITYPPDTGFPSVNRLMKTLDGQLWFADKFDLYRLVDGRVVKVEPPAGTLQTERFYKFIHLHAGRDGKVWLGTRQGLFVIDELDKPFRFFDHLPDDPGSLSSNDISEIYEDSQGRIWVGTLDGVSLWLPEQQSFRRYFLDEERNRLHKVVFSIFEDSEKRIWIGSTNGLFLLDEQSGEVEQFGGEELTDNRGLHFIKGDDKGNLWLVIQTGVLKYNPTTQELQRFDQTDGLSGSRYFVNLATQSSDGRLYLSSRDGIYFFHPGQISDHEFTSPTVLTDFSVLGNGSRSKLEQIDNGVYTLSPNENYLKFEFSTLDLLNARKIRYYYKLEGLDKDWIDNGNNNQVMYTNLSGGDYRLRVRPAVKNNLFYEDELVVDFHIATPIWRQGWMLALYFILVLFAIQVYISYRNRQNEWEIDRQKRFVNELEHQVQQKTRAIREESEKLAEANQVKSQFLANMSHEIRTPLTSVIGHAESVICGDVEGDQVRTEVAKIHSHSKHLLALLNDVLDVTRIEENKLELEPVHCDLNQVLCDLEDMFVNQAQAKGLAFSVTRQLPNPLCVYVDELRLKQVLINLCSNAIKFTERGQVNLIASMQGDKLLFTVIDTGIGMSEAQIDRVFEVFTQADASINRRFGGSGLGLALSKLLVELMHGELRVTSSPGKGSIFTFDVVAPHIDPAEDDQTGKLDAKLPTLSGSILLAEDHPDNRQLIERLLKRMGLTVYSASNGFEAIELFNSYHPQVVLLDIQMPQKDGIQTFTELRQQGCVQPIIAITANAMAHDVERYLKLGFDGYLTKPIDRGELIKLISSYYENQSMVDGVANDIDTDDIKRAFIQRMPQERATFSQLAESKDDDALRQQAHRLAGAAQIFSIDDVAEQAMAIETALLNNDATTAYQHLARLLRLLARY